MSHQVAAETHPAVNVPGIDTGQSSGLLLTGGIVIGIAAVIAVIIMVLRERHHRKRRAALETHLSDLEGIILGLVNQRSDRPTPITDAIAVESQSGTESFCPRGPLSTAISILRTDAGVELPPPDRTDLRATCFVYENLKDPLTPGDLADGLNLSLRSLQRGLGGSLGCTPTELILAVKMREAKRLLIEDEARVQEAARAVGFDDPFHFSRRFKTYYGVSPTEMQERLSRSVA